jgi:hypothetical protein
LYAQPLIQASIMEVVHALQALQHVAILEWADTDGAGLAKQHGASLAPVNWQNLQLV